MSGRGRPVGKSQASLDLIEACQEILEEIQPATVRAVCYWLFTMRLLPDMSKGRTNKISNLLTWARENYEIDWEWIVDETREAERVAAWTNPDVLIDAAVHQYRRNNWQDQSCRVEVWSEKGTVRGTLKPVLDRYGVTFRVMRGFASATAVNDIAELSNDDDRPLIALYVGDFDPSGMFMSEVDLPDRLERYGAENVELGRVALLRDDIDELPCFDVAERISDRRHNWFVQHHGHRCCELDAMPPPLLRARVEAAIEDCIDHEAWGHAVEIERVEVESMQKFHADWAAMRAGKP